MMKVSELKAGATLDSLVAMAQGWDGPHKTNYTRQPNATYWIPKGEIREVENYTPSSGNAQTYELIEKFRIQLLPLADDGKYTGEWEAAIINAAGLITGYGYSTPAEAICKAVIASVYGDVIPNDVMEQVR